MSGAAGVLTYDVADEQWDTFERLAIMFSVPSDYYQFRNSLALRFLLPSDPCDKNLYESMYTSIGDFVCDGTENYRRGKLCSVRATMTPRSTSLLKVEVWDA